MTSHKQYVQACLKACDGIGIGELQGISQNGGLISILNKYTEEKTRMDWLIAWLSYNDSVDQMPVRDWVDLKDARDAIDEVVKSKTHHL